jgi:hypothetical protein
MFDMKEFQAELEGLINRYGVDNYCNMHDFVLANLLCRMIVQIAIANNEEGRLKEETK